MRRSRTALAGLFATAGTLHFLRPRFFEAIVPPGVPRKPAVVVSGLAELGGAAALLHPRSRRPARWWLLALLLAVFPANVHMAVRPERVHGLDMSRYPRWALWARLPLQPLAMLWVWRATGD